MALLFALCFIIFNIIPTLSLAPNCDNIIISCTGSDPNCCQGPCCSLLHQYGTSIQQSPIDPEPTTSTIELPPWAPKATEAPNLNEECVSNIYSPYQCSPGLKCKFKGSSSSGMFLIGNCKVPTQQTGCKISSDCYRLNDACINGRCSKRTQIPISSQPQSPVLSAASAKSPKPKSPKSPKSPKTPGSPSGNNGSGLKTERERETSISGNNVPIINRGRTADDHLEDQEYEVDGGQRNIPLNVSEQAQLTIGVLCALCAICALIKCCSIFCRLKGGQRYMETNSNDGSNDGDTADRRTDCAVEADVEWSDETEEEQEDDKGNKGKPGDEKSIMKMKSDKVEKKLVLQIPAKHEIRKIKKQFKRYSDDDLL